MQKKKVFLFEVMGKLIGMAVTMDKIGSNGNLTEIIPGGFNRMQDCLLRMCVAKIHCGA